MMQATAGGVLVGAAAAALARCLAGVAVTREGA